MDEKSAVAVLTEYEKAPGVTRERLYLEAVQDVLANSSKVIMDVKDANSLMYLPLDRILGGGADGGRSFSRFEGAEATQPDASQQAIRDVNRGRRVR